MEPRDLPVEVLDNLPTRRVKPIVEQIGPQVPAAASRAAVSVTSLGDLKVFGLLVSALGVAVGLAVMALAFGLGAALQSPPPEVPVPGERPLGPGLGKLAPPPAENPYDVRSPLSYQRGEELLKAVDTYAGRGSTGPVLLDASCGPRPWRETVPVPRPTPEPDPPPQRERSEVAEPQESPTVRPVPVESPAAESSVGAAAPAPLEAEPISEDLAQVLDGALAPRQRFAAWARLSRNLSLQESPADLLRLAGLLGQGGNLHLEWSIVARLRDLTGQDYGRDPAAWQAWLRDRQGMAQR